MYTNVMYSDSSYVSPFGSQAAKAHVMKNVKYVPVPKEENEDTYSPKKKKMSSDTKFNLKFFGGIAALGAAIYGCVKHKGQIKEFLANPKLAPVKEAVEGAEKKASGFFSKVKTGVKDFFAKFSKKGATESAEKAPGFFTKAKNAIKEFFSKKAPVAASEAAKPAGLIGMSAAAETAESVIPKAAEIIEGTAAPIISSGAPKASVLKDLPQIPREILIGKNVQPFVAEIAAQEAGKKAGIIVPPAVTEAPKKGILDTMKGVLSKIGEKLPHIKKEAAAEGAKKPGLGSIIKDTIGRHLFKK